MSDQETKRPFIFVALPSYNNVIGATAISLFYLGAYLAAKGVACVGGCLNYPDIAECRNVFLSIWYDNNPACTHLLFVDSDMKFPPALVHDMIALDKPLVGCIYRRKSDAMRWIVSLPEGPRYVENGFMPVDGMGMGITMISRSCVDAMVKAYPGLIFDIPAGDPHEMFGPHKLTRILRFFDKIPCGYASMSEDYSFCKRYRDIGGEVYANVGHQIGHIGLKEYGGRMWDDIQGSMDTPYSEAAE